MPPPCPSSRTAVRKKSPMDSTDSHYDKHITNWRERRPSPSLFLFLHEHWRGKGGLMRRQLPRAARTEEEEGGGRREEGGGRRDERGGRREEG